MIIPSSKRKAITENPAPPDCEHVERIKIASYPFYRNVYYKTKSKYNKWSWLYRWSQLAQRWVFNN